MMVRSVMPKSDSWAAGAARAGRRPGRVPLWMISCGVLLLLAPRSACSDDLSRGLALFNERRFDEAIPYLERASTRRKEDADVRAWLAETYRRLGRSQAADSAARAALSLVPCHAFAHGVIADNSNPQYGDWPGADRDSSRVHSLRAVECDSTDGNVWMGVWIEALRLGDGGLERRALRRLVEDGFLAPPTLAYARWMLAGLPKRCVLLVNGDVDTYPTRALQELEGFRTDVAVLNVSMLELDWYRRLARDRHGVPMPFSARALDDLEGAYDSAGTWVGASARLESGWRAMLRTGLLDRPLAYSISLPMDENPDRAASYRVLEGAHYLALPWAPDAPVDTARIRSSLRGLSPSDFAGAWVSTRDRSPIRRGTTHRMVVNLVVPAIEYAAACGPDRRADALSMLDWVVEFDRRVRIPAGTMNEVAKYRAYLLSSRPR